MTDTGTTRRPARPAALVLASIGVIAAVILAIAYALPSNGPDPTPPQTVRTEPIEIWETYEVTRSFVGRVEARRRSEIAFDLAGEVTAVLVDEGAAVAAGTPLARLDTDRLEARKTELDAARAEAQADLSFAERAYRRRETAQEPAYSKERVEEALRNRDAASARVDRIGAQIRRIEIDLEKSEIAAPFDALVVARRVDEGEVVAAGTPVLTLIEAAAPEARVGLAGPAAASVAAGDRVTLRTEGGASLKGRVRTVLPQRSLGTRTVDALVVLDTDWDRVRDGDLVRLPVTRRIAERGAWLPLGALEEGARGLWAVYVAEPAGSGSGHANANGSGYEARRREVEVLHQTAERAYVRGLLRDGDRVIVEGGHKLAPGMALALTMNSGG